ncbi:MAG: polysaccharide biosynthesis C-terminal domain-containing protein [Clostridia bacterium]|nr:polysaccharide biosynthesis C-terminal domain-containing protein [Clostridia bacterium]
MNKRKRFYFNGILMSAVGVALRTVALAFGAYISHKVGAEGVGLNTLIMSVYGFALTFATSGINLTVTRLVARHIGEGSETDIGRTLRGATAYAIGFSLVATLVLAGLSGFFATVCIGDVRAVMPLQILSLSLIPSALVGVISGYFVARRRIIRNSVIGIAAQAFRIVVTVLILLSSATEGVEAAVRGLCIGISLSELVTFLLALILFMVERRGAGKNRSGTDIAPVFEMALPLAASAYIRSGLLSVEHNLIPKRLEERGVPMSEALSSFGEMHGMALPMVTYPMAPLSSFAGLLLPEFAESEARGDKERMSRIASEAISKTLSYAILSAVILFLFSEDLGYIIYGSYRAGSFIAMLAPIVPIMYIDHVVDSMLKGIGEQVYSMWVNIIDSALSVLLVFILIPILGIEGYAVVIIVMELFNFLLSYIRLRKRIRLSVGYPRVIFVSLVSAALASLLVERLFADTLHLVPFALFLKIVFAVCAHFAVQIPLFHLLGRVVGKRGKTVLK